MVLSGELLALLLQLLLHSLAHSLEQLLLQASPHERLHASAQLLPHPLLHASPHDEEHPVLQEEHPELVLDSLQLLEQLDEHSAQLGSLRQEVKKGVGTRIAKPNTGSIFSDASLKKSLLFCKCFMVEFSL
jgi:hypothetical protein